jgi:hypothetical protein
MAQGLPSEPQKPNYVKIMLSEHEALQGGAVPSRFRFVSKQHGAWSPGGQLQGRTSSEEGQAKHFYPHLGTQQR